MTGGRVSSSSGQVASTLAKTASERRDPTRRLVLQAGVGALLLPRPAWADRATLERAVLAFTGGVTPEAGGLVIDIAPLIENGNAVPVTLSMAEPARVMALFNELNPQREVIQADFGPRSGAARLATRIRLATSQQLVAVAQTADGRWRSQRVDVVVTLAACVEGG